MSTLKANSINNISASAGGIQIDSSGAVSGALPSSNRNLLYNGAMQVHQRGTSTASITTGGYYTADRWQVGIGGSIGTWTQSVESDAPTGSGFSKSLKMLCTTADAAPAAGDSIAIIQSFEGQDLQRVAKGTSSAQSLTLSFWVKSNTIGTYIAELVDADNNRHVAASYSISASATWEKKTITFPADTTGAFDNDNAASLRFRFWLAAGSDFTSGTLATTWVSTTSANRAAGQTNLAAATNNYWQVSGVQLEVGPVATPFEFKSYGQELRECQRYYIRWNNPDDAYFNVAVGWASSTTQATGFVVHHPVSLRVPALAIESNNMGTSDLIGVTSGLSALIIGSKTTHTTRFDLSGASGLTQYRPLVLRANNSTTAYVAIGAEL